MGGSVWPALMAFSLGVAAVALLWVGLDWLRLVRLAPSRLSAELFERLQRQADDPALARSPGDTPYEFAEAVAGWLAPRQTWDAGPAVRRLADLYVRASYSPRAPAADEARRAIAVWYRLRWQLWRARWRRQSRTD